MHVLKIYSTMEGVRVHAEEFAFEPVSEVSITTQLHCIGMLMNNFNIIRRKRKRNTILPRT